MDAQGTMRVMLETMDAYDRRDFDRLGELYAKDVRWLGIEPGVGCRNRDDVFAMFRERIEAGTHLTFDEMRSTPHHVILTVHVGDSDAVVTVFDIEGGRITHAQDYASAEAAGAVLA